MLMMKIQHANQYDAGFIRRIHSAFIPITGLKCSYGKIFSPFTEISVGKTEIPVFEPARPLMVSQMNTKKILQIRIQS